MEKWEKNANRFLWTQRKNDLLKAMNRYPNSEYFKIREKEYNDLVKKLENLEKE